MRRALGLTWALLVSCGTAHGPAQTAPRVAYFSADPLETHAALLEVLSRWRVRLRSDDGLTLRTRPFKDGESVWTMRVELSHSNGTTAVLVSMDILKAGDVEPDVVETDYEAIVRWQIGGDPDAFELPERPTHTDLVRRDLVDWLKRWRAGRVSNPPEGDEERARNRRELLLSALRMRLPL